MVEVQTITQPTQPDIQYHPDYEKYTARAQRRKATEQLPTTLPADFPQELESQLVWEGNDVEKRDDWIFKLNDAQREEIDAALKSFKGIYTSPYLPALHYSHSIVVNSTR
jgi:hypothetical protein